MEQQWLSAQHKLQIIIQSIIKGDSYFTVEYMPVWGAISLGSAALLGWSLALQKMFPSFLRDYAKIKSPNRIMQLHLDQVMMGTILLSSSIAFSNLPHFIAQPLTFGCLMNPLGFLPLMFWPNCDKTLLYRGGIGISFISSTIGFVGLAWWAIQERILKL